MKKVLIVYNSRSGNTKKMAEYLAEGVRIIGLEVLLRKTSDFKTSDSLVGYDAYIFGSPTYHKDMTGSMKQFLFLADKYNLEGKVGGAFGSHTHSGESAPMIFDTMEYVLKMDMINLGALTLTENQVQKDEGITACQKYAKAICEELNK